jgi:septal ring factor EnvC (AmiA/AmiB activator)
MASNKKSEPRRSIPKKAEPAVRLNCIHAPGEEMKLCKNVIETEKEYRRSLKIRTQIDYVATQKAYLEEQIASFQAKLNRLMDAQHTFKEDTAASWARTKVAQDRLKILENRHLIEKFAETTRQMNALKEAGGMSDEQLALFSVAMAKLKGDNNNV